ncbi:MAG: hypothetical protein DWQ01_03830 [Planctomycetota bacterium]|nr:MAG: hypothetical protein DWQ01_03830 [Planctomycetota bacterium]
MAPLFPTMNSFQSLFCSSFRLPWSVASAVLLLGATAAGIQDQDPDPLGQVVLKQDGRAYTARQVLEAATGDPEHQYIRNLVQDSQQRSLYLRSPMFLDQVHQYSRWLLVQAAGLPEITREQLESEARLWAKDRQKDLPAQAVLLNHRLEISWRSSILATLQNEFSEPVLRQHMLSSVPEFFYDIQISWLRLPLIDARKGAALPVAERQKRYQELAEVAARLQSGKLSWEQAVDKYALHEGEKKRKGLVGLVRRSMTDKFEEPLLRHTFDGLGYKNPDSHILRGPIMGQRWVYLVRVESLVQRMVPVLQRVRDQVDRSLREKMLQAKLRELETEVERQVLAPIFLD